MWLYDERPVGRNAAVQVKMRIDFDVLLLLIYFSQRHVLFPFSNMTEKGETINHLLTNTGIGLHLQSSNIFIKSHTDKPVNCDLHTKELAIMQWILLYKTLTFSA